MTTAAKLRLRIVLGLSVAIGPGKADLLAGVAETGSIAAAGRRMGMSYKRAWYLLDSMNRCFPTPLVSAAKGGRRGGGAQLTPLGAEVLALYRRMEERAAAGLGEEMRRLEALVGEPGAEGSEAARRSL